jgi:integrase
MRPGEIRACRVEWFRLADGAIDIPHCAEFSPKGGKPRTIPLSRRLVELLMPLVASRHSGLLFSPTRHQGKGTGIALWQVVRRLREAGLPIKSMHCFRHHYLSMLASKGVSTRVRMEAAGHAHSRTADIYTHVEPGYLGQIRAVLDQEVASEMASVGTRGRKLRAL